MLTELSKYRSTLAPRPVYFSSSRGRSTLSTLAGALCVILDSSRSRTLLPTDQLWSVGVDALRSRLQEVLASNIRREFSNVKREVLTKLSTAKRSLKDLGEKRQTPDEQRRFIMDIASRFREVVSLALNGNYSGNKWFDQEPDLMYTTAVVNRNEKFANDIEKHGHT
jgi:hypothetical protein